jgi:crotonobetainyl-CoA:carnitine CoA-transferase CaiB-like acyl-CoA transferase
VAGGIAEDDGGGAVTIPQRLAGLRVVEFTHMVMGPTCGMIPWTWGVEVKVEPIDGEGMRRLLAPAPVSSRCSTATRRVSRPYHP